MQMNNVGIFLFFLNFGIMCHSELSSYRWLFPSIFSYSICPITHNNEVFNGNVNNMKGCQQIHDGWFSCIWVTTHYKKLRCVICMPIIYKPNKCRKGIFGNKILALIHITMFSLDLACMNNQHTNTFSFFIHWINGRWEVVTKLLWQGLHLIQLEHIDSCRKVIKAWRDSLLQYLLWKPNFCFKLHLFVNMFSGHTILGQTYVQVGGTWHGEKYTQCYNCSTNDFITLDIMKVPYKVLKVLLLLTNMAYMFS